MVMADRCEGLLGLREMAFLTCFGGAVPAFETLRHQILLKCGGCRGKVNFEKEKQRCECGGQRKRRGNSEK